MRKEEKNLWVSSTKMETKGQKDEENGGEKEKGLNYGDEKEACLNTGQMQLQRSSKRPFPQT